MQVRWLRKALRSLDEEAAYMATDDPGAARKIVDGVLHAVAMLADQPGLGHPGRLPGTRELIVSRTRYLAPYRVRGDIVEVLRVFHSSRPGQDKW